MRLLGRVQSAWPLSLEIEGSKIAVLQRLPTNIANEFTMTNADNPADIAREALKLLATQRLAPTPDHFYQAYHEIAGLSPPSQKPEVDDLPWNKLVRELLKQWDLKQSGLNSVKKKSAVDRVLINFGADSRVLFDKLQALVQAWAQGKVVPPGVEVDEAAISSDGVTSSAVGDDSAGFAMEALPQLREVISQALLVGVVPHISQYKDLADEALMLAQQAKQVADQIALAALTKNLRQYWLKLALRNETDTEVMEGLLRLLQLLVDNIGELVVDDQWMAGQIDVMKGVITPPFTPQMLYAAEQSFKDVVYKQGALKHGLTEAKATLKTMVATFIDRLGEMSNSTSEYHQKIGRYAEEIVKTDDIYQLNHILESLLNDTRGIQLDIQRSRDEMVKTQHQVTVAEKKIQALELELSEASEMVRQDHLTGALNRRGMAEAFEREMSRAQRLEAPLCVALLDVDHFKKLNDAYGHEAGDSALIHLVCVLKDAVRPTDIVSRYGGEEFLILLPATGEEEALQVVSRVQRELTRRFFMHNNQRLLLTFSAGVSQWRDHEPPEVLISRADSALYRAKVGGRNRVIAAD